MTPDRCPIEPSIEGIDKKLDVVIELHRYVIKWLVICVCVIAMGTKAFDSFKELFGRGTASAVQAETK
jgi:hypothetical protein